MSIDSLLKLVPILQTTYSVRNSTLNYAHMAYDWWPKEHQLLSNFNRFNFDPRITHTKWNL